MKPESRALGHKRGPAQQRRHGHGQRHDPDQDQGQAGPLMTVKVEAGVLSHQGPTLHRQGREGVDWHHACIISCIHQVMAWHGMYSTCLPESGWTQWWYTWWCQCSSLDLVLPKSRLECHRQRWQARPGSDWWAVHSKVFAADGKVINHTHIWYDCMYLMRYSDKNLSEIAGQYRSRCINKYEQASHDQSSITEPNIAA